MNDEQLAKLLDILSHWEKEDFAGDIDIPQSQGKITEVSTSLQNVGAVLRKQSQEKKQLQDTYYRQEQDVKALTDNSPDIIARFDHNLRHVFINPTVEKYTGMPASSFIGKTHKELSMPEGQEQYWTENIEKVFTAGKEVRFEFTFTTSDHSLKYFQARLVPETAQDGSIQYVLAVAHDITELKERTLDLEKERVKDQAILANIGDGLVVVDAAGKIMIMNQVAQDLLGIKIQDGLGHIFIEMVQMEDSHEHPIPPENRPMALALRSNQKITASYYYRKPDKTRFPVAMTVTPLVTEVGIIGAIEVFRDVTRSVEVEHAKDEFISMVSHELRTPISAVKGLTSMALSGDYGELPERLRQPMMNVYISSERQIHVINDLLNITRLQTGTIKYTLLNFSLEKVTAEVVQSVQLLAKQKRITVTLENGQETFVQGDDVWVKEILHNIVINAVKFTSEGGVKISYRLEGDQAMVVVSDTGAGIPPEGQARFFGKFEQLSTPELGRAIGSGLGLYIAREVARKMGGDVSLEKSVPGEGSTFILTLPKADTPRAISVKAELEKEMELSLNKK